MKFATAFVGTQPSLGVVHGNEWTPLNVGLRQVLECGSPLPSRIEDLPLDSLAYPLASLKWAPPVPDPASIICLGLNYRDHAKEGGRAEPEYPWFFMRSARSLVAHEAPIRAPRVSTQLDYEAELAVVIGSTVPRHTRREEALQHVFGYSLFNDVSVRDYQRRTPQWTVGKNFDATGAFGPILVTADELPAGATGLRIQGRLNGEIVQDANTSDMIFPVDRTIALLSECMTLGPGDVLVMGTPSGVGQSRQPPLWLKAGDTFTVEIEKIGLLSNRILAES
jgi:2-keto-4-pentenoate hydratase/2-oxohepta-3-ene-1,7-dioic acid hydratase in catechol pathway